MPKKEKQHDPRTCENSKPCTDCEHPLRCDKCDRDNIPAKDRGDDQILCDDCVKVDHDIMCDSCGKPATRNVQQAWIYWKIKKDGGYSKNPVDIDPGGCGDNYNYCDDCEY